jgi:hypothetical protein
MRDDFDAVPAILLERRKMPHRNPARPDNPKPHRPPPARAMETAPRGIVKARYGHRPF